MKNILIHRNRQKRDIICSKLYSNNKDFKFLNELENKTHKKSNVNSLYKTILNFKMKNKEKYFFIMTKFIHYNLMFLLLISTVLKMNCLIRIILKDSNITLKVSQSGTQKIFNNKTIPDEILIDGKSQSIKNFQDLNPENNVSLIWKEAINNCEGMFDGCNTTIEINFTNFDAKKCSELNEIVIH